MSTKYNIGLMTYAIDGRKAKGTAVVARHCVEALLSERDSYELVFLHYEKSDDPIYSHGVREIVFPTLPSIFNNRFFRQLYFFLTTKESFDLIHWFQPRIYPFYWLARTRKVVVGIYGTGDLGIEAPLNLRRLMFNWTLRNLHYKVSAGLAISEFAKKDIVKKYGFREEEVHVIPNGVEECFAPPREEDKERVRHTYALPKMFFLNVARMNPGKNAFRTIRAFIRFLEEHRESTIDFVNVGHQGEDTPALNAFLTSTPFKDRVHFVEYVEQKDLPALYGASYALVFPLLNEGFGLPVLEGMASGTAVIASKTCVPEITDEALLVDALSEKSIADGMARLYKDKEFRGALVEKGRVFSQRYSWEHSMKKLISLYSTLLSS
jgi:glycosyltransferase involved in cell wall biosynthesis